MITKISPRSALHRMSKQFRRRILSKTLVFMIFPILPKRQASNALAAPVLCIAGRTGLDEAVAVMLAQILSKQGIGTRLEGVDKLSSANILRLETKGIVMVCVSFLNTDEASRRCASRYGDCVASYLV